MPAGGKRSGFRFAVADDARDDQIGIVERRAEGVRQRIAQFSALVNRAGRLRRHVAGNAPGERELGEEAFQPLFVLRDVGIHLAVRLLQIRVGHHPGTAVAGAGDVDDAEVVFRDHAIQVRVHEVQPRRRAPMTQQARLDVCQRERCLQQRIVIQVDLPDGEVVRSPPIRVDPAEFCFRKRRRLCVHGSGSVVSAPRRSTRDAERAIISSSFVGMTRTVTRLPSAEITWACAALRPSCSSTPRKSRP